MARRKCFLVGTKELYQEIEVEFQYFSGFSLLQKQRSISSLHENILKRDGSLKVLEVSTKSPDPLGVALSAFNLTYYDEKLKQSFPVENIFQSSKVFERGGPYRELLYLSPKEAKRDERLISRGRLIKFSFHDEDYPLEPKTMFYDFIYLKALNNHDELKDKVIEYNAFTDIEFNHERSINCQARSVAIFVALNKIGRVEELLKDRAEFVKLYKHQKQ